MRYLRLGCAIAALVAPVAVIAQDTTASIRGRVVNDTDAPVANATVVITHKPSGSRTTQTTDADGGFNASGLRLGGPYSVEVMAAGFDTASELLSNLSAGTPQRISVLLVPAGQTITVSTNRLRSAIAIASGPATVLNSRDIAGVATVNRDIRNLAARSPFVSLDPTNGGAISIAGQNNRFNRITVDGIQFGDPFGLEAGGLASARGPVPLDAIGEFSVEIAPADIQQGGFQGGAINTQLKSGTNKFHGTGFYTYTSDSLAGDTTRGIKIARDFKSNNFGVQLTGPIIKDKLFFALTWERLRDQTPAVNDVPASAGITQAVVDQITSISNSVYKYDPLAFARNVAENDDKVVAKVDWNIADGHRAAFTYIYNKGNILAGQLTGQANATNPTLPLQSNNYDQGSINHYGVFQLNDQWSDEFSTQVRVSYNDYKRLQVPYNGRVFGQFQTCVNQTDAVFPGTPLTCPSGVGRLQFGPDISRQANELSAKTLGIEFQAQLKKNDHAVKFIAERRSQDFDNLFAQRVSGQFYFDSIADLQAQRAGQLVYAYPIAGTIDSVRALFKNNVYTFGLQDVWDATEKLTLTAGFRWDIYQTDDTPRYNPDFVARSGFGNNATLNGRAIFQPRVAASWDASDRLQVRGSAGLFAGGNPNVWISNNYANPGPTLGVATVNRIVNRTTANPTAPDTYQINGVTVDAATANTLGAATLNGVTGGPGIPAALNALIVASGSVVAPTNELDPNFRIPSQWRVAGSVDYDANFGPLGDHWNLGADVVWSRVKDALTWVDLRSVATGALTPDGRRRYNAFNAASGTNTDVLLTNTDLGYSWNIVGRVNKRWDNGIRIGGSYTFQRAKDLSSGTSSVAFSNYTNAAAGVDPNNAAYGTSNYQIDNAYRLSFGFDHAFFGDNFTRIEFFYNSRAGQRFSYTMADLTANRSAVFGVTGTNNRYLIYVPNVASPTADPLVQYGTNTVNGVVTAFDFAGFQSFVQNGDLSKYQGQIAPKNIGKNPRFNKLDLHISQELPLPLVDGAKFELFGDIENVLNLLNNDWGSVRQVAFPYYGTLVNVSCVATAGAPLTTPANTLPTQACAQYRYTNRVGGNFAEPARVLFQNQSLWQIRIGARVRF